MKAINLKTEYLENPLGIDIRKPRLFWNCDGGVRQSAYQIIATADNKIILDTGKVISPQMAGVPFGAQAGSKTRVYWKVRLWDENDKEGEWSEQAFFETAFLNPAEWKAKWITGNYSPESKNKELLPFIGKKIKRYPVDCFCKEFSVAGIENARLYITACGLYEAYINGKKIGNYILTPGHTDYNKRVQYQTYDVTELLNIGKNKIEIMLADGWYRGSTGGWGIRNQYGYETKLICQLEQNGNVILVSDDSWKWSNDGPIRFADNQDGEIFDSRMKPSYSGKAKLTTHKVVPVCSNNVPVLEHERLNDPKLIITPKGKKLLDFGQNIAGYVEFDCNAKEGQKIYLRFGELIDENGELTLKNIQTSANGYTSPHQEVKYICSNGRNHYKTRFAVFGFQYVLVDSDVQWSAKDFTAVAVYSDLERTGWFESSNTLLNKFVENTVWSAKNNFLDIPTDCPTRERHGWSGDAQIFCKTACYLFDFNAFAQKYLNDLYDWQKPNGKLPQIAPAGGIDFYMQVMNGSVGWADAGVLMPYNLWKQTDDKAVLKKYWSGMVKYAEFMKKRCGRKTPLSEPIGIHGKARRYLVNIGQSYGEWAEPADVHPNKMTDMILPHPEESTAYTAYIMGIMAEIANALGKTDMAKNYRDFSEKVKKSYRAMRRLDKFTLDTDRQASLVRPLYMNLLDEKQADFAKKRLVKALDNYGWRLGTGFLSTPFILSVLADIDIEYAYKLLENEEMPGWLFMPKSGANTIWESWEGTAAQGGIASLNHYSKGAVCEWLFSSMCGIQVNGENHFVIKPMPGGHFTYAKALYKSIFGKVYSGWKKENGKYVYEIEIPANTTAEIILPNSAAETVTAGSYRFEI